MILNPFLLFLLNVFHLKQNMENGMKKWMILILFYSAGYFGCQKEPEIMSLTSGSFAYQLGNKMAPILPVMDPVSNRVLATTRDFHVSAGEVLFEIHSSMGNETANFANTTRDQLASFIRRYTKQLVEQKLLVQAAGKAGIQINDSEAENILNQQYQKAGGREKLLESLKKSGMSITYMQRKIVQNLMVNRYLDQIVEERVPVTEKQVMKAYVAYLQDTTVSVRHIVLRTQGKSEEEKKPIRKKMEAILSQAKRGDDFAQLARTHTEDPVSKETGGLYEDLFRGVMVKPFEDAAFTLPIGQISGIIESQFGYHILTVIERKKNDQKLAEVRDMLEANIRRQDRNSVVSIHTNELIEKAGFKMIPF
jgi:parvulin-like peptidyl-prolyl isomerase